tara:strand:+ start:383 stop:631 length:249 start_codon:yes stop_codon:yes gene_type:complete
MSVIESLIKVLDESELYYTHQTRRETRIDPPEFVACCKECGKFEMDHTDKCMVNKLYEHIQELDDEFSDIENRDPDSYYKYI